MIIFGSKTKIKLKYSQFLVKKTKTKPKTFSQKLASYYTFLAIPVLP